MLGLLLLLQTGVMSPSATPWKLTERTSPSGVHSVTASVTGRDGLSRFVVKCDIAQEPIVSVQFVQPNPIGAAPEGKPVSVRFDGGMAFTDMWQFPGTAVYISDPAVVTQLTGLLVKAKEVSVETTNDTNFAVQATFSAPGGETTIRQVLSACHYTLGVIPSPVPSKDAK